MAHTWWHVWGEVGERSNITLDTGQQKPAFNPGVPEGKIGTETLDAIGNWFNNTTYGKRFKAGQERQAALEQTLIDQGGPMSMYYKLKNQPNQLEQQILEGVSNLPNLVGQRGVDRRISDPLTYLALSGGIRGTAKGVRAVANNPRAMQGLKNINPLAPASKKIVDVKSTPIHGKPIPAETSASVLKKGSMFRKGSESQIRAYEQQQINSALQGKQSNVFLSVEAQKTWDGIGSRDATNKAWRASLVGKGTLTDPYITKKGSSKLQKPVKQEIGHTIDTVVKREGLTDPEDFDRRGIQIQTPEGEYLSIQGMTRYFAAKKEGRTDAWMELSFPSKSTAKKGAMKRALNEKPPKSEIQAQFDILLPDQPEFSKQLTKEFIKDARRSFAGVKEESRIKGLSEEQIAAEKATGIKTKKSQKYLPQWDAGHGRAVEKLLLEAFPEMPSDTLLQNPPTTGSGAIPELRKLNIGGGNNIEYGINPHVAIRIGWPRTWQQAQLFWYDKRMGFNNVVQYKEIFTPEQIVKMREIKMSWSEAKVDGYFETQIVPTMSPEALTRWRKWQKYVQRIEANNQRGLPDDPMTFKMR